ncbi:LysR family transcriptional regulator [Croceitalea sp. MTPC9]|uniref:LysR substrate-binding domain-containing protein n=1 Tax=unclassified Croceitalea TaxID=2632280 RepID=UPI002B3F578E|nr:LysR family transcriptional regulator [Croceitalea sp. MTPC6]GMN16137.1 LysR family transcriptional regulator [Croceitalea sp. MTPC9]
MISLPYMVFFEVATHLSFTKAANSLCISQPAVSKQVKNLESILGIALLERKSNKIKLTPAGKKLYTHLKKAKALQTDILTDVEIIKDELKFSGQLTIGSSTSLSIYVLPKIISQYVEKFPNINIRLINRNNEGIIKALLNREIDLAITEGHVNNRQVQSEHFMDDEIIAICSAKNQYANRTIEIDEVPKLPLVLRELGSGTLMVLEKELKKVGVNSSDLNVKIRLGGIEVLKNFLSQGTGIGFLSKMAVAKELHNQELCQVYINGLIIKRKFNLIMRRGEEPLGLVKIFIREAKKAT